MKIKSFKLFENEEVAKTKSYGANQHMEFCEEVSKWSDEMELPVRWCLYGHPKASSEEGYNKIFTPEQAKRFWDMYVKGDKKMTIVEMGDKLIGILHSGDQVEMAFDNMDMPFDKAEAKKLI